MCLTAISLDQKVIGNVSPFFWCFQLRITSELYPSPTRTHTHIFFCKPCCLGWFPFKPQKTHPSQGAQYSYLLQLYHSEQMTGIVFLYYLQHSFIPYVKPNSSESHSQNIIIDQNCPLWFHSTFSCMQLCPHQIRSLAPSISLHYLSVKETHTLGFPTTLSGLPRQRHSSPQWMSTPFPCSLLCPTAAVTISCAALLPTFFLSLFCVFRYSLYHGPRLALSGTFLMSFPNPWQSFSAWNLCWLLSSPQDLLSQHFHLIHLVMLVQAAAPSPLRVWDPVIIKRVTRPVLLCSYLHCSNINSIASPVWAQVME